jgi:hypothetical protein
MRPFEITLLAILGLESLRLIWGAQLRLKGIPVLPALAIAASILQIIAEGYRWQMLPAYLLAIVFFLTGSLIPHSPNRRKRRWILVALAIVALPPSTWTMKAVWIPTHQSPASRAN